MRNSIIILMIVTTGLSSCGQGNKATSNSVDLETLDSLKYYQSQNQLTNYNEKYIDTEYEYTDSIGNRLIIQNSLPRGGLKYTDPKGKEYIYAVFWTRIINESINPFELTVNFPKDSYELQSSTDIHLKILIPSDTMTVDKESLFNYGLRNLETFLDHNIEKKYLLNRTINPKEESAFYVVLLTNKGINGTLRTGFSLNGHSLYYRVNDQEMDCGYINFLIDLK